MSKAEGELGVSGAAACLQVDTRSARQFRVISVK
jgi:hypothetical protein